MNALDIKGLSKVYKGKKGRPVQALKGLDLSIATGEIFGFLGPNGAGKSTTIKTVMGQVRATQGSASVFGVPVTDASCRKRIGYLSENPSFYEFLTARELLLFVGRAFAMDQEVLETESDRVLRLLELEAAADRPIKGYSKGMVQRLGLAQTLLHDPDLYILDEPMSGLDPLGRALVKEIIKDLKARGKTVFFSTHITADIEVVCDRVGVIAGGTLQVVDSVENILRQGVEGYIIQLRRTNGGSEEIFVDQEFLDTRLAELVASGAGIERIEPKRKGVEAFFLDIIGRGGHASGE